MDIKPERVLIMGCGGVGLQLAGFFSAPDWTLYAQLRSKERAEILRERGATPIIADLDATEWPSLPIGDALVYYFIPPQKVGQNKKPAESDLRLQRFLNQAESARHIVYISTTGVYGHCSGDWVSELRPVNPQSPSSLVRVAAEQQLYNFHLRSHVPVTVLRVAAIYGAGRLPVDRLRRGEPVLKKALAPWSNRIHIDDLVQVCFAAGHVQSFKNQKPVWQVYNVSDGQPSTMTDYFLNVADILSLPRPKEIDWLEAKQVFSPAMLVYLRESKRIDNHQMLEKLNITLRYLNSEMGLPACIEGYGVSPKIG